MEIKINDLGSIREAARQFIAQIGEHKVFAFYGNMGAGKTTFVKAICEELGVDDVITSPTFAIINEYHAKDGVIYHFDFYRIKKLEEVYDMGYEDYFYSGALCFIEWPELIEELLPEDAVKVSITENADGTRTVSLYEPSMLTLYSSDILFLEIQISLYDEKHFFRIERSAEALVLCPLAHIRCDHFEVDLHFLVIALQNTACEIIVNNDIHHVEDILVAIEFLDGGGHLCADIRQFPSVLLFVETDLLIKTCHLTAGL